MEIIQSARPASRHASATVFISHDGQTSGRRVARSKVASASIPRGYRNPHPRAISNAATCWILGTLYTMYNTHVRTYTLADLRPSAPLYVLGAWYRRVARMYVTRARLCRGREDLATGLSPRGPT